MNPTFPSPSNPNLVTCLMTDRMADVEDLRRATEILDPVRESPHRFRRFLTGRVRNGAQPAHAVPLTQGH
jgi:hypothetical protein